ncbi:3-deoxy-manno-octulosonate-8-phosphatase KdsC [Pseudaeromonas sharmana]|uniref:3-deoxy-D-manno-octulosonate 8-phosphate phosphatase KdsC n=1 Tax=Pseudaeromonas sharmana TaxID=328412 RepID=A0ABV8CP82_9GAMM
MSMVETLYGDVEHALVACARRIRLLVCDVDGVLSDGRIYMGNQGEELKAFHTKDGFGLKAVRELGIEVAIITGRNSRIVSDRMAALGIEHLYQGQGDKLPAFEDLLDKLGLDATQAAYIGDDVIDIPVMQSCALGIAVADAHPLVLRAADYITRMRGGEGAVREVCDLLLQAHDKLEHIKGASI